MPKKLTQEQYLEKCRIAHGDWYDYSKTVYINSNTKLTITCPLHGDFEQLAQHHPKGIGCMQCGRNRTIQSHYITPSLFLERAAKIHQNYYNYPSIQLVSSGNVEVECPIHGVFSQDASVHLAGHGCYACGRTRTEEAKLIPRNEWIYIAKRHHGDIYDYSHIPTLVKASSKVSIGCKVHGMFKQLADSHIRRGHGCRHCSASKWKKENLWLDRCGIPDDITHRQVFLRIGTNRYKVDGLKDNVVYEFLGDFWHGNPKFYNPDDVNHVNGRTFGELYDTTIKRIDNIKLAGYDVIYIWENEFNEMGT